MDLDDIERTVAAIPRNREVVVYRACPNEASAATVALKVRARGFCRVRPLADGIDAWSSAGLAVDRYSNDAPRVARQSGDLLTLRTYAS